MEGVGEDGRHRKLASGCLEGRIALQDSPRRVGRRAMVDCRALREGGVDLNREER